MKRLLLAKFLFAFGCFYILSFISVSMLANSLLKEYLVQTTAESMYRETSRVASGRLAQRVSDYTELSDVYDNLSALASYQDTVIWLMNAQGEVVLDTGQKYEPGTSRSISGFNPADWTGNYYQRGDFYGSFDTEMLTVASPINTDLTTKGYVLMHYDLDLLDNQRYALMNVCYLVLIVILLLALILLAVYVFTVYRPLNRVAGAAAEYAAGNLNYRFSMDNEDEIGFIGASLQYMAGEINKSGEYQRKFISNISHDFRSPLTSIKGYVEAILDGTIPPEMQERYLKIVVTETERLNSLTQGLLTLNNFDDKKVLLDLQEFDINEVIRSTSATFEGICRQKGIQFQITFDAPSLIVSADKGKIQQVLYNLIDNAIKFSYPNSVICLETSEQHDKVLVSVKDHGEGIPKENINKIWERFYKGDSSRGKDKKGTGLGLSIAKEIIQAHGENINVVSTEGTGTEFTFSLTLAHS